MAWDAARFWAETAKTLDAAAIALLGIVIVSAVGGAVAALAFQRPLPALIIIIADAGT